MPTYILYKDPEQLQRCGLKQAGPVCFKRGFIERGCITSPLMLSTFEKKTLIQIVLTPDQFES